MTQKRDPNTVLAREIAALEKRTYAEWQAIVSSRPLFGFEHKFIAKWMRLKSKADLARFLGISRQHLNALAKQPGAPADSLDPEAWRQFIASRLGGKRISGKWLLPVLEVCGEQAPALWFVAWCHNLTELLLLFSRNALTRKQAVDIAAKIEAELDLHLRYWIESRYFEKFMLAQLETSPTEAVSGANDTGPADTNGD